MAFGRTRKTSADRYAAADVNAAYDDADNLDDRLDLLEVGILAGNKTAWVIAGNNAPADIKALADAVCDGVADQIEINAYLAINDKRPIWLAGTFDTTGPIGPVESGGSPILHDLIGFSEDYALIRANHTGNALQIHSTQLPQEWRITIANLHVDKGATLTPIRGISIQNAGFLRLHRVMVNACTTTLYGYFANTCTFTECQFGNAVTGLEFTGIANQGSHLNLLRSCYFRANDVGVKLTQHAQNNVWNGCTFDHTLSTDIGFQVPSGATKIEANVIEDCWFEGAGTPLDLQAGEVPGLRLVRPRFAIAFSQKAIKVAGFGAKSVSIDAPYADDGRSLGALPAAVTFSGGQRVANVRDFLAVGDGIANDTAAVQNAIDALGTAGGTVTGPLGTYKLQQAGTFTHDFLDGKYCLRIPPAHGPITLDFPRGTVFRLANSQASNLALVLLDGTSIAYRTNPTVLRGITFDGNVTAGGQAAWTDHALVQVLFSRDVTIEHCTWQDVPFMACQVMRDSSHVAVRHCFVDGRIIGQNGSMLRMEANDITIENNLFVTDAVNGRGMLDCSCNADVQHQGRGYRIVGNYFAGGRNGTICAIGGAVHCVIEHNVFRDQCHTSGMSLQLSHYTNTNGTIFECSHNTVRGNIFFNVRIGIVLTGTASVMSSVNYTSGATHNLICDNIITRDPDLIRTMLLAPFTSYPVRSLAFGSGGIAAPNAVPITTAAGIQSTGQVKTAGSTGVGTATAGGASTLTDSTKTWTVNGFNNWLLVLTGGTGKGQVRHILSGTATVQTVGTAWDVVPDTTTTYVVTQSTGWNTYRGNKIWVTSTTGKGIELLNFLPETVIDNQIFGSSAANAFPMLNAPVAGANNTNVQSGGNRGWTGNPVPLTGNSGTATLVYADEGNGVATIVSGTTAITVTHKLGRTPLASQVRVTATNNPTNDPGHVWVDAIGATTFAINCRVDPGASGLALAWSAAGSP